MRAFRVRVDDEHEDWASAVLWEEGTAGVEVQSANGRCQLLAYFADHVDPRAIEAALAGMPGAEVEAVDVPPVDWVARFREHFRGFAAPPFFIAPVWDVPTGELSRVLVVDPGRAPPAPTRPRLCLAAWPRWPATGWAGCWTWARPRHPGHPGRQRAAGRWVDGDAESIESAVYAALNRVAVRLVRGDGAGSVRPPSTPWWRT
jgi:hypothetical protein